MKKEDLIKMGLTEEQAEKVANASSEELKNFIPKSRFDEVNEAKKLIEADLKTTKEQIESLSKINPEELQKTITTLQENLANKDVEYQTKIKEMSLNSALKMSLNGKVHDVDIVSKLLDIKNIELDDKGNITKGLDEQLKTLQESKSFLFVPEKKEEQKPQPFFNFGGKGNPTPQPTNQPKSMFEAVASHFQKNN